MMESHKYPGAKMASFPPKSVCVAVNIKRRQTKVPPFHPDDMQERKIPYAWQPGWRAPITV